MPNPPMCFARFERPAGGTVVSEQETQRSLMVFKCEKFMENPAGSWYMVLKDTRPNIARLKQRIISKLVVQVWASRQAGGVTATDSNRIWLGIVDGVAENEHVSAKSYYTELVITGRCMGGVLVDMPVVYEAWGDGFDDWWSYSRDLIADRPDEWMRVILEDFVYRQRGHEMPWRRWIRTTGAVGAGIREIPVNSMIVRPQAGQSVWGLMEQCMLRPWTETWIDVAGENAGVLTHRVKPWNGLMPTVSDDARNAAPPVGIPVVTGTRPNSPGVGSLGRHIHRANFISQKTHISDDEYYNHVMVVPGNDLMVYGEINRACEGRNAGEMATFGCDENIECQRKWGLRSMKLNFNLGYPVANNQNAQTPFEESQRIAQELLRWYGRPFERAEITVRGDMYHIGYYLTDDHSGGGTKNWYIEGVSQEYIWGDHWYSTVHVSEARAAGHNDGWASEYCASSGSVSPARGTFEPSQLFP